MSSRMSVVPFTLRYKGKIYTSGDCYGCPGVEMRGGMRGEYEWSSSGVPPRIGSSLFRLDFRKG